MKCPFCNAEDTQVKDSRQGSEGRSVKRRRFCSGCNNRFTTHERVENQDLLVIKKSGIKRIFDRDKIVRTLQLATRKRNISEESIDLLVDNLVRDIEKSGEKEIASLVIGEKVMTELSKLDEVSYIRFASVYHDFSNIADFRNFLNNMKNE